jgi:IclR helix-turn-helix domain
MSTSQDQVQISIELSQAQVDRIVREASGAGSLSVRFSGLADTREGLATVPREFDDTGLSRSLLTGLLMLAAFPADGSYVRNSEIAAILDVNVSTAHRHISTLVAVGLLERDHVSRRYRLAYGGQARRARG